MMKNDDSALVLAASAVSRARELLEDGWVQNDLRTEHDASFCIHGALHLAIEEIFGLTNECGRVNICGGYAATRTGRSPVEAIATAYIVNAAADLFGYDRESWKQGKLGAAQFNDEPVRKLEDIISVMGTAAERLWEVAMGGVEAEKSWAEAEVDSPQVFAHT